MRTITCILSLLLFSATAAMAQPFERDYVNTDNGQLTITFIKHSSLVFSYQGHVIYVDPVSTYADYSDMPKADVVLITHEHADHFDPKAIAAVEQKGTMLILNPATQKMLGKGMALSNYSGVEAKPYLTVEAVPAYNTTPANMKYHPQHRDNGYILTIDGLRIYVSGDTEDIPEMADLKDIDIAFLSVNQPYTMTIEQAVKATQLVKPRIMYPYHYNDTPVGELAEVLKNSYPKLNVDVRIRQLQ